MNALFPGWPTIEEDQAKAKIVKMMKRIDKMHYDHGNTEGQKCRTCAHLLHHQPGQNSYLKCELYGITSGAGTDWRAKWDACGKWIACADGRE